jgi:hypothetical protein
MSHLSPAEFIDLADGRLASDRTAHAAACAACRAQADEVRDALQYVETAGDVPEPSPLFWDHLSARVREAVSATPARTLFGFDIGGLRPAITSLAALVLVVSAVFLAREWRTERASPAVTPAPVTAEADAPFEPTLDPSHAAAWAVLTAAAADLQLDDARKAGIDVPSAAVDRAVTELSRDELSELGRLLQSELKRSSN